MPSRLLTPAVPAGMLAGAIEQVLPAAAHTDGIPVLNGIFVELEPNAITLTATDRYRLSTRTLVARQKNAGSAVVSRD